MSRNRPQKRQGHRKAPFCPNYQTSVDRDSWLENAAIGRIRGSVVTASRRALRGRSLAGTRTGGTFSRTTVLSSLVLDVTGHSSPVTGHCPYFPLSSFLFPLSSFLFPLSSFLFPLSSFLFPLAFSRPFSAVSSSRSRSRWRSSPRLQHRRCQDRSPTRALARSSAWRPRRPRRLPVRSGFR